MKAIALRAILAAVCGVGLIFSLAAAAAGMRVLDADDMPRLDADEGLLLVTLDTEFPLEAVYMKQEGAVLNSRVLKNVVAGRKIALAESCTGGLVAAALTEIPGSSSVLDRSFVTYSIASE